MHRIILPVAIALTVLAGCTAQVKVASTPKAEFLPSARSAELALPFSDAVRAGDFLFLSGQIGNEPNTMKLAPGGIGPETRQTLENIQALLAANGASLTDVVKCTAFLADIAEWAAFNEVYRQYFRKPYPARSALGVGGLVAGARIELECSAFAPLPPTIRPLNTH